MTIRAKKNRSLNVCMAVKSDRSRGAERKCANRFKVNPCVSFVFTHYIIGLCVCMYKSADGYDFTMNAKIYAFENRFLFRLTLEVVMMLVVRNKQKKTNDLTRNGGEEKRKPSEKEISHRTICTK